jgi:Zn-dependent protease/CBS domain-containing protein
MIGVPVARIFGIEVRVQLGWILILALIAALAVSEIESMLPALGTVATWGVGAVVAGGFFLSSAAHDLAHALVARRRGVPVPSIAVSFFGGVTAYDPSAENANDDLAIAASGPLMSLGIAGATGLVAAAAASQEALQVIAVVFAAMLVLNLIIGGINLVPAYPLDGGRIVRAIAWRRSGNERSGWRAASQTGQLSGFVAIGAGVLLVLSGNVTNGAMVALSGWFLILSARTIRDRLRVEDLIGGLSVADAMDPPGATVHSGLTIDTFAGQLLDGESGVAAVPVTDGDEVVGVVGVRQVRRLRRDRWPTSRVEDVMVKPPRLTFLSPNEDLATAAGTLTKSGADGLPVMVDGRLEGMLTRRSIGRVVAERMPKTEPRRRRF